MQQHSINTNEPVIERRVAALKSVEVQTDVMRQFAENYRFTVSGSKEVCIDSSLDYLNRTFFRKHIEDGRQITTYHQMQVITVSLETGLNPFNNELYGTFTSFGDLKVLATVDGWMRLATSQDIDLREFTYSESTEKVTLNGHEYSVPTWVECRLNSKEKGASQAREYFWEVYNNSANQTITWSRPTRTLTNVSLIQALRRMLRITALADSDVIADINRHYEAEMMAVKQKRHLEQCTGQPVTQKEPEAREVKPTSTNQVSRPVERKLNIDIQNIEVIDLEISPQETATNVSETHNAEETEVLIDNEAEIVVNEPVVQQPAKKVTTKKAINTENVDLAVLEQSVPRSVLMIIKPILEDVRVGKKTLDTLKVIRNVVSGDIALQWFDAQIALLEKN